MSVFFNTLRGTSSKSSFLTKRMLSSVNKKPVVLITGALGQLGSGLAQSLRKEFGLNNVITSDIRRPTEDHPLNKGPFLYADVLNYSKLEEIVVDFRIDWVIHLSALLSAVGEKNVQRAILVNNKGFENVLELSRAHNLRVLCPSTIGAFGPTSQMEPSTPDLTIQRPTTIYGVTKVYMELLGEYYHTKFGVDFRSLRLPGVISADSQPGGGTTDYAVDIFHHAIDHPNKPYKCYLKDDARLPMIMLEDVIRAMHTFTATDRNNLKQCTYNLQAVSFTPAEISAELKKKIPNFAIEYEPDFRQAIAQSWPRILDDSNARRDWGWNHKYDTEGIVDYMLNALKQIRATANNEQAAAAAAATV